MIAWLGEETKDSELVIQLVDILTSSETNFRHLRTEPYSFRQAVFKVALFIFDIDANLALLALSTKAYWSRAWIFQELALA